MRVAIVTKHDNGNYGASLQAYALSQVVQDLGHQPVTVRYRPRLASSSGLPGTWRGRWNTVKNQPVLIGSAITRPVQDLRLSKRLEARRLAISQFEQEHIPQSAEFYTTADQMTSLDSQVDLWLCGSDNIWIKNGFDPAYAGGFVTDGNKIASYAAGFAAKDLTEPEAELLLPTIGRMRQISVREDVGASLLASKLDRPVRQDLDPTLLLTTTQWQSLAQVPLDCPQHYLFGYFLGKNPFSRQVARQYAKQSGLPLVGLPHMYHYNPLDRGLYGTEYYQTGPAQFVGLVQNAQSVLTDSYHGVVFALLLNKPVVAFQRFLESQLADLNSRLPSLYRALGIDSRTATNPEEAEQLLAATPNYSTMNMQLDHARADSIAYLERLLSEGERT